MSFFNYFSKSRREQRKQLKRLRATSAVFSTLETLEKKGLLHWQSRERQLLMEETLAYVMLSEGEKKWKTSLQNILLWQSYRLAQEQAEADRINIEAKAVREARKKYAVLTKADIERIRQQARSNMSEREVKPIEDFDIFIIRANAPSSTSATEATGELLAIGHYDIEGNHDLALWEDVKHNLKST